MGSMRRLLRERWRQDRLPILLYLFAFIVMSYPFVLRMHEHLPMNHVDTHEAMWQNWWVLEALQNGYSLNYTHLLFHPNGLDLTLFHPRWASLPVWMPLYLLFGDPFAFNLTAMIGILLKAYGMYVLGVFLFKNRISAWVAGAFYALAAASLAHALQQPLTGATEWIPWFMLAFVYGLEQIRTRKPIRTVLLLMIVAGFLYSLNAYANLKIGMFAMLLGGGYVFLLMIAKKLWKSRLFWLAMLVFGLSASLSSAPLLLSVLQSDDLQRASLEPVLTDPRSSMDLLTFFKAEHSRPLNYMQSIASMGGDNLEVTFISWGLSHVGLVSMAFALMGVVYAFRFNLSVIIWIVLAVSFFLLSLGIEIFAGRNYIDIYWTPYRLVQDNFIFRTLRWPFRMMLIFLFPYAILIGYGLQYRLRSIDLNRSQRALLTLTVCLLLYGTSIFPIPSRPAPHPKYLSALATWPDGAIIDVPFSRRNSMYYMSLQRFHRRPIIEGSIARIPPRTYDYIDGFGLLAELRAPYFARKHSTLEDWREEFAQLVADGFRYVVLHRHVPVSTYYADEPLGWILNLFAPADPLYEDEDVLVYDIADHIAMFYGENEYEDVPTQDGPVLQVGDSLLLHAWSLLNAVDVQPCQSVTIESWWQITQPDETPYTLLIILADEKGERQLAIAEKVPADKFTTEWKTDRYSRDQTAIAVPCTAIPGKYVLLMGMKESMTGEPLAFRYHNGDGLGTLYYLTTLNVQEN